MLVLLGAFLGLNRHLFPRAAAVPDARLDASGQGNRRVSIVRRSELAPQAGLSAENYLE